MPTKTFISYHHANDQWAKDHLVALNSIYQIFSDYSVNSGEINDEFLTDEEIRVRVRDGYIRDSTVTVVLVGTETRYRKHVDWELYSSMRDTSLNPKSGIILVPLPSTNITSFSAAHGLEEKESFYPNTRWVSWNRTEHEERFPHFSRRMIDNLSSGTANISVVPWEKLTSSGQNLTQAIAWAHRDRVSAVYDFSTPMRRRNGPGPRR